MNKEIKIQEFLEQITADFESLNLTPEEREKFLQELNNKILELNAVIRKIRKTANEENDRLRIQQLKEELKSS